MPSNPSTLADLESRAASASSQCGRLLVDVQQLAFQIDRSLDDLRGQLKVLAELATDGFMELNRMCRLIAKANASSVSVDSRQRIHDVLHSSEEYLTNTAAVLREALSRDDATVGGSSNIVHTAEVWRVMIQVLASSSTLLELRDEEEARQNLDATAQDVAIFKDLVSQQPVAHLSASAYPEQHDPIQSHEAPPSYNSQVDATAGIAVPNLDIKSQISGLLTPAVGPSTSRPASSGISPGGTTLVESGPENDNDSNPGPMGFFRSLFANLKTVEPLLPALCSAAAAGQIDQVRSLLLQGANVNGRNEKGNTPLISATRAGQLETVKLLIDSGADIAKEDKTQRIPPLFYAANIGRPDIFSLLLELGADPGACNSHGTPYFNQTVEQAPLDMLQELLKYGAKANSESLSGKPVIVGVVEKGDIPRTKMLLDWGARITSTTPWGDSLLFVAIKRKDMTMVRFLLDRGASPDSQSASGQCVLSAAVSEDLQDVASLLLERRANVNGKNASDAPCLITAIQKDLIHMTHLLLKYKAKPDSQDGMGRTAVQLAVQQNRLAHLHALLKHGAKADVYSLRDNPILTVAVTSNLPPADLPEYIRLLAEHGASAHKTSSTGSLKPGDKKTPFAVVVATGQLACVEALIDAGAVSKLPPGEEMDSDSILEIAARTGKIQIVRAILGAGIGTTQKALMYAYRAAKENMVLALEDQIRREALQPTRILEAPAGSDIPLRETPPPYTA